MRALRRRLGGQFTFVAGSEATLFVRGLVPGRRLTDRFARIKADPSLLQGDELARYLTALAAELRPVFGGPLTYASLSFEQPDWRSFDIVGVDHYRDDRVKDRFLEMLEPHLATGLLLTPRPGANCVSPPARDRRWPLPQCPDPPNESDASTDRSTSAPHRSELVETPADVTGGAADETHLEHPARRRGSAGSIGSGGRLAQPSTLGPDRPGRAGQRP